MKLSLIKRKIGLILFCLIVSLYITAEDKGIYPYSIFTKNGEKIDISTLVSSLTDFDIVFIGEFHGHPDIHRFQHDILILLMQLQEDIKPAVSMEMFERDVQKLIESYMNDEINEEEFLSTSRPWPNYNSDYRPIIEFAKKNGIPVLASNVPRRIASHYVRTGSLEDITDDDKNYAPEKVITPDDEYKRNFFETIGQIDHPKTQMSGGDILERMYYAQCLKDDTMAESIYRYKKDNQDMLILHLNGDFHSRSHLGTVSKLGMLDEDLKIAVISPVSVSDIKEPEFSRELSSIGDFILFVRDSWK